MAAVRPGQRREEVRYCSRGRGEVGGSESVKPEVLGGWFQIKGYQIKTKSDKTFRPLLNMAIVS
jgi:hypothetical protein